MVFKPKNPRENHSTISWWRWGCGTDRILSPLVKFCCLYAESKLFHKPWYTPDTRFSIIQTYSKHTIQKLDLVWERCVSKVTLSMLVIFPHPELTLFNSGLVIPNVGYCLYISYLRLSCCFLSSLWSVSDP